MARHTEANRVTVDRARIERAIVKRDDMITEWNENVKYFVGEQWDSLTLGATENEITVNKIFPMIRAQLPSLIFSNPRFTVSNEKSGVDQQQTDAKEHLVNSVFTQAAGEFAARMSVLSAFFGIGCIKVGYTPTFVQNPKRGVLKVDESGEIKVESIDDLGRPVPALESGEFIRDDSGDLIYGSDGMPLLEPAELLTNEDFFVRWLPWKQLLFDPEGTNDFRTHRWFAEEWVRPTEDVKKDPLLKNTAHLQPSHFVQDGTGGGIEPLGVDQDSFDQLANEAITQDEGRTRGWTIYDFIERRIRVVADSGQNNRVDRYLRDDDMPPELWDRGPKHGGPFSFLIFNEVPGRWQPYTDIEPLKSIQDELNMQRSKISTHLKRSDRKYLAEEDFLSNQEEWSALEGGGDMSIVTVENKEAIKPLEQVPMDGSIFTALPTTSADFDEIGGAAEQRGVANADTATQGAIIENRQQIRESDRRDNIIRQHLISVGSKLMKSIQANMLFPIHAKIMDPKHRQPYLFNGTVTPQEVDGDADVSMDISSIQPRTNAVHRQQTLTFLQNVFIPMMSNPITVQFLTPGFMDELFELYEIGNTELADQLGEIANMIAVQAQQQQGQGASPDANTGSIGQLAGALGGGTPNPLAGLTTPTG